HGTGRENLRRLRQENGRPAFRAELSPAELRFPPLAVFPWPERWNYAHCATERVAMNNQRAWDIAAPVVQNSLSLAQTLCRPLRIGCCGHRVQRGADGQERPKAGSGLCSGIAPTSSDENPIPAGLASRPLRSDERP